jgi:ecdysteroid 25-hydroxylase CYP306A1
MITYYVFDAIKKRNYPPSPLLKLPILGHLTYFDPKKPYQTLYELSKKYGKIYGLQLGAIYTVVISDVNLIREALKRDEFNGRAPLYVTHGIMGGHGEKK